MELTLGVGLVQHGFSLAAPVHVFHTIGPQELHVAAIQDGVDEVGEHALGILAGRRDGPDGRRAVKVAGSAFQRSDGHQLGVALVLLQVDLQVGSPGASPVGEHAGGIIVELVAAVLGAVGQGGGIDPALGIALAQSSQSILHGRLGEAVHPLAFRILVEGGIGVLIELRQVVDVGSLGADEAGSGQGVGVLHAVAVRIVVHKGVAHGGILVPGGGSFHAHSVQPGLLDVGDAAAADAVSKAVQAAVDLQGLHNLGVGVGADGLGIGVFPGFGHVPQHALVGVGGIVGGGQDHHVRPVAGSDLLLQHIVVGVMVGLDDFQLDAGQLLPAGDQLSLTIRLGGNGAVHEDGDLLGLGDFGAGGDHHDGHDHRDGQNQGSQLLHR